MGWKVLFAGLIALILLSGCVKVPWTGGSEKVFEIIDKMDANEGTAVGGDDYFCVSPDRGEADSIEIVNTYFIGDGNEVGGLKCSDAKGCFVLSFELWGEDGSKNLTPRGTLTISIENYGNTVFEKKVDVECKDFVYCSSEKMKSAECEGLLHCPDVCWSPNWNDYVWRTLIPVSEIAKGYARVGTIKLRYRELFSGKTIEKTEEIYFLPTDTYFCASPDHVEPTEIEHASAYFIDYHEDVLEETCLTLKGCMVVILELGDEENNNPTTQGVAAISITNSKFEQLYLRAFDVECEDFIKYTENDDSGFLNNYVWYKLIRIPEITGSTVKEGKVGISYRSDRGSKEIKATINIDNLPS